MSSCTSYAYPRVSSNTMYLDQINKAFEYIEREYVKDSDKQKMTDKAIAGMLSSLDPHSYLIADEDLKSFYTNVKGEFGGIGVEIVNLPDKGMIQIVAPIDDLPSAKAGIKPGDCIVAIDGEKVSDMSFQNALNKMRGEPGSKVTIMVLRDNKYIHSFDITRAIVRAQIVRAHLHDNIAYARITSFAENTIGLLKKEFHKLQKEKDIKGIVLDLRSNPGGLLDQAVSVSDYFLDSGTIVTTKGRGNIKYREYTANSLSEKAPKVPLIVLVNHGSASASEIVASALKDHKRGIVLGTKTFGKGSVQEVNPITKRLAAKLTVALYYSPNDISIQAEGVKPDIEVNQIDIGKLNKEAGKYHFFSEKSHSNHLKKLDDGLNNLVDDAIKKKTQKHKATKPERNKVSNKNAANKSADNKKDTKPQNENVKKEMPLYQQMYLEDYQYARAIDLLKGMIIIKNDKKQKI